MYRKVAYLSMFTALAMIIGYIETLIPISIGIPGAKLGLANLVTLLVLDQYTWKEAMIVNFVRILLTTLLFGNVVALFFSLSGGMFSLFVMAIACRLPLFSLAGISLLGGVSHNIGQLFVAACLIHTYSILYYLPFLILIGAITGMINGIVAIWLKKYTAAFFSKG